METNRRDVEQWFNTQVGRAGKSEPVSRHCPSRGPLIKLMFSTIISMVLDCVSDGGAEPAGGDKLSTAAVLPEGDH